MLISAYMIYYIDILGLLAISNYPFEIANSQIGVLN